MNSIKEKCELFLRYKYEYYILAKPTVSDMVFDAFEKELRDTNDPLALEVVDLTDFPSVEVIKNLGFNIEKIAPEQKIKSVETKYKHWSPMQSISKLQINDIENIPYSELNRFLSKIKVEYFECTPKYDGNAMSLMYEDGKLVKALTRGDGLVGLDKILKMKLLVPNYIDIKGKVEIRGENVISKDLFQKKYSKSVLGEDGAANERNYVAGVISKDNINITEITELSFVAYSLVKINEDGNEYVENTMDKLDELGFNKNHKPFIYKIKSSKDFQKMYFSFKKYREVCDFLLDGIVVKYPENVRNKLKSKTKYPAWSLALKFESEFAETTLLEYEWTQGKNNEFTPVAILEEVELGGTMNRRASCHNLSYIIKHGCFPGCVVKIRKAGEIINQVVDVVKKSSHHEYYMNEFNQFMKSSSNL